MTNGEVPDPSITEVAAHAESSGNEQALGSLGVGESVGTDITQCDGDISRSGLPPDAPVSPISWFSRRPGYKTEGEW